MMKRIPLNALQKAIYNVLGPPVYVDGISFYDDVPEEAALPYGTFGAFTCKSNGTKTNDIADVTLDIYIWSEYEGKKEVNKIANDIITILSAVKLDLTADGFYVTEQGIDMFESFPEEDTGYCGVIKFVAKIQNLGG